MITHFIKKISTVAIFMILMDIDGIAQHTISTDDDLDQTVCLGEPIASITFTFGGGAADVILSSGLLPTGTSFNPSDNTISGTPTVTGTFDFEVSTTGPGTSASIVGSITISQNPGVANNTTSTTAICETQTKTLSGAPSGGTWSVVTGGGNLSGTTYTPADVSINTSVTIRYTIAAIGACEATTSDAVFTVNVNPGTANNTTSTSAICESQTKALSGTPAGGTWSVESGGGSISGSTYTPADVSINTNVTVRYTIASNGACSATTSDVVFTVTSNPDAANNTTSTAAICETQTKALSGTPSGGTWSIISGGGSISGTTYTPGNVSANTSVTIRYTISANGSCPATTSDVNFTVNADPGAANNSTSPSAICETQSKTLSGSPSGGTWSIESGGGNITGTTYTPADVSVNTNVTIRYTIASNGACPATTSDVLFIVNANPGAANNTTSSSAICETQTKSLSGTPSDGIWSVISGGGSITGTTYTPADVSVNTLVTVRYTIAANGACVATNSDVAFTVNANSAAANNTTSSAPICETQTKTLSGSPAGGTWTIESGGGQITGSTYDPDNISVNTNVTIRYSIAANGACSATTSDVVFTVNSDLGTADNLTSVSAICETQTKDLIGSPTGGSWTLVTTSTGAINGTMYDPGNVISDEIVTIRYSIPANGACASTFDDVSFTVNEDLGAANNTTSSAAICETQTKALTGTPSGGTWSLVPAGSGISGTTFGPIGVSVNTTITVRYTIGANGACQSTASDVSFVVNADPGEAVNTTSASDLCDGDQRALTGNPSEGTWTYSPIGLGSINIPNSTFTASNVTETSNVTIIYTIPANGACEATTSEVTFEVNPLPDIEPLVYYDTICSGNPFAFLPVDGVNGFIPSGTEYYWQYNALGTIGGFSLNDQNTEDVISQVLFVNSSQATANYVVTPVSFGSCQGNPFSLNITVRPGPQLNDISNYGVCDGDITDIPAFGPFPQPGVDWSWIATDGDIIGIGEGGNSNQIPDVSAIHDPNVFPDNTVISVDVTASSPSLNCSITKNFLITVYPTPTVQVSTVNLDFCHNQSVSAIPLESQPAGPFNYESAIGGDQIGLTPTSDEGVNSIPSFTALNNTIDVNSTTITATAMANGCPGETTSYIIEIYPILQPSLIIDDIDTICGGTNGQIVSAQTPYSASYLWQGIGPVTIISGNTNDFCVVNFTEPGNASIILQTIVGSGCFRNDTAHYFVAAPPEQTLCSSIVPTPDGNGLACLNPNVDSFQWGTINVDSDSQNWLNSTPDISGNGQDQFYYGYSPNNIPDSLKVWVKLCDGDCCTTVYYPDGCTDSPDLGQPIPIVESEENQNNVRVFPNPAGERVYVKMPHTTSEIILISIYDAIGNLVLENSEYLGPSSISEIDISSYSDGIYHLKLSGNNFGEQSVRFIKQ